jgi:hypothetical protein
MIDHKQQLMLQQKAESEEKQSEQELNKGN